MNCEVLLKHSLLQMLSRNDLSSYKQLLKRGISVNQELHGSYAVHEVCRYGYTEFLEYLIAKKANLNLQDGLERTAFMIAVEYGNTGCLKVLLEAEASWGDFFEAFKDFKGDNELEVKEFLKDYIIPKHNWEQRKAFTLVCKKLKLPKTLLRELIKFIS